jgi:LmbE family N-acetylglucosaminyl deacetylase
MDGGKLALELKYIYERTRNRIGRGLSPAHAVWSARVADLPPGDRFLVLAPHQDDDAIGCGGTIIKLRAAGKKVRVAYLTDQPGPGNPADHRLEEAAAALKIMGVEEWSSVREAEPSDSVIRARIKEELEVFDPDVVFVPSPIENQAQHIQVFDGYLSQLNSGKGRTTLLYEVWTPIPANLLVDITAQMEPKERAIAAHASQTAAIDYPSAVRGLGTYRAAMAARKGYAEGFLCLERGQLNDLANMWKAR